MRGLLPHLDRVIDLGLILLLVFTPLAFGAVEDWAQAIAQILIAVVFAAWVLKITWGPAPLIMHLDPAGAHTAATEVSRRGRRRRGLLGGRVVLSGLEVPALLFAGVVAFQAMPLTPETVVRLSPRTAALAADSHPAPGRAVTVRELERWLLEREGAPTGPSGRLPPADTLAPSLIPDEAITPPPAAAGRSLSLAPAATWRHLVVFLGYLGVFLVGVNHWRDRRHADRAVATLAAMAGVVSLLGILQKLTWNGRIYWLRAPTQGGSVFGPFVNQNHFAGYVEMILPAMVGLTLTFWLRARLERDPTARAVEQGERTLPFLVLLGAAVVFGVVALLACGSRGGVLALSVAGAAFLLLSPLRQGGGWKGLAAGLLLVAVAAGVAQRVGGDRLWARYASLADPSGEPSFAFRLDTARRTLQMAADFPLVGVGLGAFDVAYSMYVPGGRVNRTGAAHNDYAELLAETGAAGGFLAAAALLILLLRYLLPALVRSGSPRQHVIHGLAVGVLAMLLHSAYDFNLQIYSNGLLFVVLVALLAADRLARLPGEPPPATPQVARARG